MEEMKYYDVHMNVECDSKSGYSIFVKACTIENALDIIRNEKLYEEEYDLNNIDCISEITEQEYYQAKA